jgi:hypothetical protein
MLLIQLLHYSELHRNIKETKRLQSLQQMRDKSPDKSPDKPTTTTVRPSTTSAVIVMDDESLLLLRALLQHYTTALALLYANKLTVKVPSEIYEGVEDLSIATAASEGNKYIKIIYAIKL